MNKLLYLAIGFALFPVAGMVAILALSAYTRIALGQKQCPYCLSDADITITDYSPATWHCETHDYHHGSGVPRHVLTAELGLEGTDE